MLASPRSEPVRKAEKIRFIDGVQPLDRGALDDLVFQRRHSERSLPPVGLWYIHPTHRFGSVRPAFQPFGETLEVLLQFLAVVPPRLPVHARCGFLLQTEVGHTKRFQVVDVVQKRREPQLLILLCCLTYPLQRTGRVFPARCPERAKQDKQLRSEEHTSELQSQSNLVCRLLLEKKTLRSVANDSSLMMAQMREVLPPGEVGGDGRVILPRNRPGA